MQVTPAINIKCSVSNVLRCCDKVPFVRETLNSVRESYLENYLPATRRYLRRKYKTKYYRIKKRREHNTIKNGR